MPPLPPDLPDDPVGEILLRIPPEDPACLFRASLFCRRWRRVLADPAFRRRHREIHRTPAVVGLIHEVSGSAPRSSRFVPVDPDSRRPAARDFPGWLVLDCRHGRAPPQDAAVSGEVWDLVVWDPLTDERRRLPRSSTPPSYSGGVKFDAAVLCAAAEGCSCDHRDCHAGPFRVVFIFSTWFQGICTTVARVYASGSGEWGELTSVRDPEASVDICPTPLVGGALYFKGYGDDAFEYQLATGRLSVIYRPPSSTIYTMFLMSTQDGRGLVLSGVATKSRRRLPLRSRETSPDGVRQWARRGAIEIEKLLPDGALLAPWSDPTHRRVPRKPFARVVGFAAGTDVIFVGTGAYGGASVYMVQLNSGKVTKSLDACTSVFPYTSFCIPVTDVASTAPVPGEGVSGA